MSPYALTLRQVSRVLCHGVQGILELDHVLVSLSDQSDQSVVNTSLTSLTSVIFPAPFVEITSFGIRFDEQSCT